MSNYLARLPRDAQSAFLVYREALLPCDRKGNAEEALINFACWHSELRWTHDTFERVFGDEGALAGKAIVNAILLDQSRKPPRQTMGGHPTPWKIVQGSHAASKVLDADGAVIMTFGADDPDLEFWAVLADDINRVTHAHREAGLVDKIAMEGHPASRLSFPARLAFEASALLNSPVKARKAPMDELMKAGLVVRLVDPIMFVVDPDARERFVEWQAMHAGETESVEEGGPPLLDDLLAGRAKLKKAVPLHEDDDALPVPPEVYGEPGIRSATVAKENDEDPAPPKAADEKSEADALAETERLRVMREKIKRWTTTTKR